MDFAMEYRNHHRDQQHGNPRYQPHFPIPCRYYQRGFCSFGVQCRNLHIQPDVANDTENPEAEAASATDVGSGSSKKDMSNTNSPTLSGSESGVNNTKDPETEAAAATAIGSGSSRQDMSNTNSPTLSSSESGVDNIIDPETEAAAATAVSSGSSRQDMSNTNSPTLSSSESGVNNIKDTETEAAPAVSSGSFIQDAGIGEMATVSCGICLDKIVERPNRREQIFGILPNCNHCFCFRCIVKWRKRRVSLDVIRACPVCRQPSDYAYFSTTWFHTQETKDNFITMENTRMLQIECRYFNNGFSNCRMGNKCPYLHALADGTRLYPVSLPAHGNEGGHIDLDMFLHIYSPYP